MLVHLLDGQVEDLPEIHFGKLASHLLGEDPRGHRRTVDYLELEQLIDEDDHHLLVGRPELENVVQYTDLGLLRLGQGPEHRMELGDGGKAVRERLGAEIEQCLDKDIDLQSIKGAIGHLLAAIPAAGYLLQDVDDLLGQALLPDGHHQLMGHRGSGQVGCNKKWGNDSDNFFGRVARGYISRCLGVSRVGCLPLLELISVSEVSGSRSSENRSNCRPYCSKLGDTFVAIRISLLLLCDSWRGTKRHHHHHHHHHSGVVRC